jgi:hypothetical protein
MSGGCGGGEKQRKRVFATSSESDEEFPQVRDASAVESEVRDASAVGCREAGDGSRKVSDATAGGGSAKRQLRVELSGWGAVIGVVAAGVVRGCSMVKDGGHLRYLVDKTRGFAEVAADNHADAVGGGRINEVLSEAVWVRSSARSLSRPTPRLI